MTVTRFAPSPTGLLHLGHAYAAWVAQAFARQRGGRFLLRFEDIDSTRVRAEFYDAALDDLAWLGLSPDEPPLRQLDRLDAYRRALGRLQESGWVYPCFCSRREIDEELARVPSAPHGPEGPLYPGTCRALPAAERDRLLDEGRVPAWRLDAGKAARAFEGLSFHDHRCGRIDVDPGLLGDVILARKDIGTSYHLAVVVDDAFQEIDVVTRGEDLLPSTHVHRLLQCLLGLPEPAYLHHPLVTDAAGHRLAKRSDSLSLRALRASGESPDAVLRSLPPPPPCVAGTA